MGKRGCLTLILILRCKPWISIGYAVSPICLFFSAIVCWNDALHLPVNVVHWPSINIIAFMRILRLIEKKNVMRSNYIQSSSMLLDYQVFKFAEFMNDSSSTTGVEDPLRQALWMAIFKAYGLKNSEKKEQLNHVSPFWRSHELFSNNVYIFHDHP